MEIKNKIKFRFAFFGSSNISVSVLNELEKDDILPDLLITQPNKPKGRGLQMTASPVKIWAEKRNIEILTPKNLNEQDFIDKISKEKFDFFILVSYGKIIPKKVIDLANRGILNLHPSLLPLLRGSSPIESTILLDMKDNAGFSIMLIDEKMDHGPIVFQKKIEFQNWPIGRNSLEEILGTEGGKTMVEVIPRWLSGEIQAIPQDEGLVTFSSMIKKEDALIDLNDDPYKNFLKIKAYENWPIAFFLKEHKGKNIRVKVTDATFLDGNLVIKKVIPEGKKEMDYKSFLNGYKS